MKRYEINRLIRKQLNIKGTEMAKLVEVTKQTICNYELGRCVTNRPLERVIELELDMAVEKCIDDEIKYICKLLQTQRKTES